MKSNDELTIATLNASRLTMVLLLLLACHGLLFGQYQPPIGIPAPDFGINETVENVYGSGYYTHWVDNTHPNASDANAPGTPENPMATPWGIDYDSGAVVVIAAGSYDIGKGKTITSSGTASNPIFFRGADPENPPVLFTSEGLKRQINFSGSYLIVENFEMINGVQIKYTNSPDHIALRSVELHAEGAYVGFGAGIGGSGDDIVIYDCHIHHLTRESGVDCHGIVPNDGSLRWWIVDNHIHHNGGDGIQAKHNAVVRPRYIYIGRNVFHEDRENAVDLKLSEDIIISENICYGYKNASTSDGTAIILGADGGPIRPWAIFNEIYDCEGSGIRIEEVANGSKAYIIGNRITNVKHGFVLQKRCTEGLYIVNNTVHNAEDFIFDGQDPDFKLYVYNNVVTGLSGNNLGNHMHLEFPALYDSAIFRNNILEPTELPLILNLGDGYADPNQFDYVYSTQGLDSISFGQDNMIEDPLFINSPNRDYSFQVGSPAIDAGSAFTDPYDEFYNLYGIDIQIDYLSVSRPQNSLWDIGANEYQDVGTSWSLSVSVVGNGEVTPSSGTYPDGSVAGVVAIPDPGYLFDGWTGDYTDGSDTAQVTMDANKSITANFVAAPSRTLTVLSGGNGSVSGGGTYPEGSIVTISATPNTGFVFFGWTGDYVGTSNPSDITINGNMTITANFADEDTVLINHSISSVVASAEPEPQNNALNTIDGDLNTRWSAEGEQWILYDIGSVNTVANLDIAFFSGDVRSTIFDIQVSEDSVNWTEVFSGQSSGTTTSQESFDFTDLSGRYIRLDCHGNTSNDWNSITEVDIYGYNSSSSVPQYTLITNTSGSGSIQLSPSGGTYDSATVVTVTATAGSGYVFSGWSGDLSGSTNPESLTMDGNKSVTAQFTEESSGGEWIQLTYDDFESGFGNYTDGGGDCLLDSTSSNVHQGNNAVMIKDNVGTGSSFYHTNGIDVDTDGYTSIRVVFWYITRSYDSGQTDEFELQYYDGSTWQMIKSYTYEDEVASNDVFYTDTVYIEESNYTFPTDMKIRFESAGTCNNGDQAILDEIEVSATGGSGSSSRISSDLFGDAENAKIEKSISIYPNPFSNGLKIHLMLETPGETNVAVFDFSGRQARKLYEGYLERGDHQIEWDGRDAGGTVLSNGVYLVKISTPDGVISKIMIKE